MTAWCAKGAGPQRGKRGERRGRERAAERVREVALGVKEAVALGKPQIGETCQGRGAENQQR